MNQDQEQLRLLSIFDYVGAALAGMMMLASLMYAGMGAMMLSGKFFPHPAHGSAAPPPPDFAGYFFIGFAAFMFFMGAVNAVLNILSARALARHERRTLCLVVAGLNCLHMPLGTALGVFTLIVLQRPSVVALFNAQSPQYPAPTGAGASGPAGGPSSPHSAPGGSPFSNPFP